MTEFDLRFWSFFQHYNHHILDKAKIFTKSILLPYKSKACNTTVQYCSYTCSKTEKLELFISKQFICFKTDFNRFKSKPYEMRLWKMFKFRKQALIFGTTITRGAKLPPVAPTLGFPLFKKQNALSMTK